VSRVEKKLQAVASPRASKDSTEARFNLVRPKVKSRRLNEHCRATVDKRFKLIPQASYCPGREEILNFIHV
jgi:hypothetical protein